jgi:hypothetical protein
MALITYCQKELGPISKIYTELKYQKDITVPFSVEDLSDKNDPLGIYKAVIIGRIKQADSDNLNYEKSKMILYGLLYSMSTKEMDERLSVHRSTIESKSTHQLAQQPSPQQRAKIPCPPLTRRLSTALSLYGRT